MPNISLWPMPEFVNDTSKGFSVVKKDYFKITSNVNCDIIDENIKHYTNILFPSRMKINSVQDSKDVLLGELNIELVNTECPKYPNSNMDESCIIPFCYHSLKLIFNNLGFFQRRTSCIEWYG